MLSSVGKEIKLYSIYIKDAMNYVKKYYAQAVGVFFRPGTLLPVCSIRYVICSAIYFQIFNHLLSVYSSTCVLNVVWSSDF